MTIALNNINDQTEVVIKTFGIDKSEQKKLIRMGLNKNKSLRLKLKHSDGRIVIGDDFFSLVLDPILSEKIFVEVVS